MKKSLKPILNLLLLTAILFGSILPVSASPDLYPERGDEHIVDPEQHFDVSTKRPFQQMLQNLSHTYVIVILGELPEEGLTYTQNLYQYYNLDEQSFLFVVDVEDQHALYYVAGQDIYDQGLSDTLIQTKVKDLYEQNAIQGNLLIGIHALVQAIEVELEQLREAQERESRVVVTEEANETIAEDPAMPWWMYVLLAVIFILLAVFLLSYIFRRKLFKKIDQLENWKIALENRPFSSELSRIKGLKMAGETEARFEKWKNEWEQMLIDILPDIEEVLIDVEDDAYSYRFLRAKKQLTEAQDKLQEIEDTLYRITQEIDELTNSEKQNREKITLLHEQYQQINMWLTQNSILLGISLPYWDEKFRKASTWFVQFQEAQERGDVLTANDFVEAIEGVFAELLKAFERTPRYLKAIEESIPEKFKEVDEAVDEMIEKGYQLSASVQELLMSMKKSRMDVVSYMEQGKLDKMEEWIQKRETEIEQIFSMLEEEVQVRQQIMAKLQTLPQDVQPRMEQIEELKTQIEKTKASYTWEAEWAEDERKLEELKAKAEEITQSIIALTDPDKNYKLLMRDLDQYSVVEEEMDKKIARLTEVIKSVREEEIMAKEYSCELKQAIVKLKSQLKKSNLPGIPQHVQTGLKMAEEAVEELCAQFKQIPVDMGKVEHLLQEAKNQVASVGQVSHLVIKQAQQSEQLIQYANRYRRHFPHIVSYLEEAETSFRSYQFREALEYVEAALDQVDPGWRSKMDWEDPIL